MLFDIKSRYRRWRIARHPVPERLWVSALRRTPYTRRLTTAQLASLRELVTLFLLDKRFSGAHELVVTDEMRVCVAVKACIPILELGLECYSDFIGIVIYPDDFRVREKYMDDSGVMHEHVNELCGQSMAGGPMVLSWATIVSEHTDDGHDLVIHECAHKLDTFNGGADGFPELDGGMPTSRWTQTLRTAYDELCDQVDSGRDTRIDPYATQDPAEFFAVMSETFFTRPDIVAEDFPDVYRELADFYRQHPASNSKRSA